MCAWWWHNHCRGTLLVYSLVLHYTTWRDTGRMLWPRNHHWETKGSLLTTTLLVPFNQFHIIDTIPKLALYINLRKPLIKLTVVLVLNDKTLCGLFVLLLQSHSILHNCKVTLSWTMWTGTLYKYNVISNDNNNYGMNLQLHRLHWSIGKISQKECAGNW